MPPMTNAMVKGVRALLGPDVALMIDFNQSLDPAEATRRIARLAPYDLHWIEEPVPQENLSGHAKVRETSPTPIQAGENWWFPRGFAEAIAAGASDFIMPDLMKCGGVTGWLQVAGAGGSRQHSDVEPSVRRSQRPHAGGDADRALARVPRFRARHSRQAPPRSSMARSPREGPGLGLEWNESGGGEISGVRSA